jgi:hypothetical protein
MTASVGTRHGVVRYIRKPLWELTQFEMATNIAIAFEKTQRVTWSSTWPTGHCLVSSLLLAPLIRMPVEWEVAVAIGVAYKCRPHAWLETPDGDVIDPTYGQFDRGKALRVLPAHQSGDLGHMIEVKLTIAQEERCRNAIQPSIGNGWNQAADILQLFGAYPAFATALKQ